MFVLAEFLMACGLVAIVGCIAYSGYKAGQAAKKDKDE